ncbi:MAG: helix-turn-helix transcriptional regulator [Actinomycetia bacterium]|nr:helix-turn-helix transcriptional regulator [Actinomycetes bacterium]
MLEALGLTEPETELYLALVRSGPCWADELGPEHGTVDAAVEGLAAKGLLVRARGPAGRERLVVSPPDIAGEVLLQRRIQEARSARAALGLLADEYRHHARRDAELRAVEYAPQEAVGQRFAQLQRKAHTEVMIFDLPPYVASAPQNHVEMEQLAVGVRYRTVYDSSAVEQHGALARIERYVAAGEEARLAHRLPLKLLVVDRQLALLPAESASGAPPAASALVHPSPLLDALVELFERIWHQSLPLDLAAPPPATPGVLDDAELQLLRLLLSGLTDDAIGRHLGVGRRTVLRRTRALMDRAGVGTRMQLGWYAARHGWLGGPPAGSPKDPGPA